MSPPIIKKDHLKVSFQHYELKLRADDVPKHLSQEYLQGYFQALVPTAIAKLLSTPEHILSLIHI